VTTQEQFLSKRQRYQPIALPQHFSDEELARDWTLVEGDHQEIARYRKGFRLSIAIQICAVRLYGRFVHHVHDVSPHIVNYLGQQLDLPPSLTVEVPEREATGLCRKFYAGGAERAVAPVREGIMRPGWRTVQPW
jgi:Domain of unknown function (DUF4158)